ncbi:MAG: dihydroorotate dehydrogenase electron transfer subunit [Myxococcota bacterium]
MADALQPAGAAATRGLPTPVRTEAEVLACQPEGGANRRLVLRVPGWPGFAPGQFAMLSPGALGGAPRSDPLLPRPMAVYRAPGGDGEVEILFKVTGRGTRLLADALPGQRVRFVGPLGLAFADPEPEERAILVAGGTGIASLYALARRLARAGGPGVEVLLGARSGADLMGRDDFAALDVRLHTATEDGSEGSRGLVTALLEAALQEGAPARVYACGPTAMMRRVAELAAARDRPCVVSLENAMACGFGVCLGCAAPLRGGGFALVCRDGPVLDAAAVDWERMP